jgi:hypothetical protein
MYDEQDMLTLTKAGRSSDAYLTGDGRHSCVKVRTNRLNSGWRFDQSDSGGEFGDRW